MEKRQTVEADQRGRPLWAHTGVRPYKKKALFGQTQENLTLIM